MPRHKLTDEEAKRGNQFTSGEQAAKNGRKGRAARTVADKKRKTMAELAAIISTAPIVSQKTKDQLEQLGIKADADLTNQALVVAAVYMAAANGDIKAFEKWQELTESVKDGVDSVKVIIDV